MAKHAVLSDVLQLGFRATLFDEIRRRTVPALHMCFPIGKGDQVRGPMNRLVAVPDVPGPIEVARIENLITGTGDDLVSNGMRIAKMIGAEFGGVLAARATAFPVAYYDETHFVPQDIGIGVVSTLKIWRMRAPLPSEV